MEKRERGQKDPKANTYTISGKEVQGIRENLKYVKSDKQSDT